MAELLLILPHLRNCAKSHSITGSPVVLLHLAIPQPLYNMYTQHIYSDCLAHLGSVPNFALNAGATHRETIRMQYSIALKAREDDNTMDDILLEEFLDMLDKDKATYLRDRMMSIV